MTTTRAAWRQFRAAFVLFHILAVSFAASPSPAAGMNRKAWSEKTVQREFAIWADRFGMEVKDFEETLWDFATGVMSVRKAVMAPFNPYLGAVGAEQNWQMFVAPHTNPTRMELAVKEAGSSTWEMVYRERDATATWNAEAFDLERLRASIFRWGWPNYSDAWTNACNVFAARLFEERPTVEQVRCRMERTQSPSAYLEQGELDYGESKYVYARLVKR